MLHKQAVSRSSWAQASPSCNHSVSECGTYPAGGSPRLCCRQASKTSDSRASAAMALQWVLNLARFGVMWILPGRCKYHHWWSSSEKVLPQEPEVLSGPSLQVLSLSKVVSCNLCGFERYQEIAKSSYSLEWFYLLGDKFSDDRSQVNRLHSITSGNARFSDFFVTRKTDERRQL